MPGAYLWSEYWPRAGMVHARNFRWRVPEAALEAVVDAELERAAQAASEPDAAGRS
jgi:hypothetical protein